MIIEREVGKKGQVVIPRDVRLILGFKEGRNKIQFEVQDNEVKLKKKDNAKKILQEFFTIARTKGEDLTLEDIKRIEDESYDLP